MKGLEGPGGGGGRRGGDGNEGSEEDPRRGRRGFSRAVREGGHETRQQLSGLPAVLARLGRGLRELASIVVDAGRAAFAVAAETVAIAAPHAARASRRIDALVARASAAVTPVRALLVAALGCASLLALSQFADYRGVAIGVPDYGGDVDLVAPPPEVGREEAGSAHFYAFVPAAALAVAVLALAVRSRRWQLTRLAALVGLAAVLVALLVDRPAGLDPGEAGQTFAGAEARLLEGFWTQLAAGAGLLVTSLALGGELRRAEPGRARRARPRPRAAAPQEGVA